MLKSTSPLRNLPAALNEKQALFFDGIRHAVEIVELAHSRLLGNLTNIALEYQRQEIDSGPLFTNVFLDAWAVVDAIDRFRSLLHLMPGAKKIAAKDGSPGFRKATKVIRDLRNVADHLAQRADYVIARKSTALGILSWFTLIDAEQGRGLSCMIRPGTIRSSVNELVNPFGRPFKAPTDFVHLSAGEYTGDLSGAVEEVRKAVVPLENSLERALIQNDLTGQKAGADLLIAIEMVLEGLDEDK